MKRFVSVRFELRDKRGRRSIDGRLSWNEAWLTGACCNRIKFGSVERSFLNGVNASTNEGHFGSRDDDRITHRSGQRCEKRSNLNRCLDEPFDTKCTAMGPYAHGKTSTGQTRFNDRGERCRRQRSESCRKNNRHGWSWIAITNDDGESRFLREVMNLDARVGKAFDADDVRRRFGRRRATSPAARGHDKRSNARKKRLENAQWMRVCRNVCKLRRRLEHHALVQISMSSAERGAILKP
jgi:hypothetical protein